MTFAALQEQLSEHIYHFNHGNQPMSTFKVILITGRMSHSATLKVAFGRALSKEPNGVSVTRLGLTMVMVISNIRLIPLVLTLRLRLRMLRWFGAWKTLNGLTRSG